MTMAKPRRRDRGRSDAISDRFAARRYQLGLTQLELADLAGEGITLRWYRRTGATVIARGSSADAAATFLGHGSTAITEGHYIEPDRTVDRAPAGILERTLRRESPDASLLSNDDGVAEFPALDFLDQEDIEAA